MKGAVVPDATLKDFQELSGCLMMGRDPLLPQSEWGQDAAFIAFVIDDLRKSNKRMRLMLERFVDDYPDGQGTYCFPHGDVGGQEALEMVCACGAMKGDAHVSDCIWNETRRFLEQT